MYLTSPNKTCTCFFGKAECRKKILPELLLHTTVADDCSPWVETTCRAVKWKKRNQEKLVDSKIKDGLLWNITTVKKERELLTPPSAAA